jgi:hypothetical protein
MSSTVRQPPSPLDVAYKELTGRLAEVGEDKVDRSKVAKAGTSLTQRQLALVFPGNDRAPPTVANLGQSASAEDRAAELLTLVHASIRIETGDPRDVFGKGGGGGS